MEKLGIEPSLLAAQVVNFAIIMFVLQRLLLKPILAMLEKRRKEIAKGLDLTEKMEEAQVHANAKLEKLIEGARKEAQAIIAEAKKQAKLEEKEMLMVAQKEAAAVVERGKHEVERARVEMEKGVRKDAIELAVAMARKLLSVSLTDGDKRDITKKHIAELSTFKA